MIQTNQRTVVGGGGDTVKREGRGGFVGSKLRTNKKCGLTLPILNIIRS